MPEERWITLGATVKVAYRDRRSGVDEALPEQPRTLDREREYHDNRHSGADPRRAVRHVCESGFAAMRAYEERLAELTSCAGTAIEVGCGALPLAPSASSVFGIVAPQHRCHCCLRSRHIRGSRRATNRLSNGARR